jgi:hypothetical protein
MVELHPRYYLHNFEALCEAVWKQYHDLLTTSEQEFYQHFLGLSEAARCLYVRLVSRRGPLFRQQQLSYPELGPLDESAAELLEAGLLDREQHPTLEELFRLYRKPELQQMFVGQLESSVKLRKSELEQAICALDLGRQEQLELWSAVAEDTVLRIADPEIVELFQLLFFGNGYQSLTDFVLSDLGVASYYPYSLDPDYRLFCERKEIDEYRYLAGLRDQYYEALEAADKNRLMSLVEPLCETGGAPLLIERRDRLRNRLARQLEREAEHEAALRLYQHSGRHPARERAIRILHGLEDYRSALELCQRVEPDPWCEAEQDFVRRQQPLLLKKLGHKVKPAQRQTFNEESLRLPASDGRVEHAAAQYYEGQWSLVKHTESRLVNSLFGLALWDQIFAPLPGAFVNPFQSAPLDMYSPDFFRRRHRTIEHRLTQLADPLYLHSEVMRCYRAHQGIANSWVNWRAVDAELLELALESIPASDLLKMWRRILFDPAANRSGLPDLVALGGEGDYCLIEVKGPGDQLQLNQKRWLKFFQEQQIPWRVARVEWLA